MAELYISSNPHHSGEANAFEITADSLTVAEVRPSASIEGEWVISSRLPLSFADVSFRESDPQVAVRNAEGWVENHITTEQPDLLN